MTNQSDEKKPGLGAIALGWWSGLQPDTASGRKGNPGALARLRRADLAAAAFEEATVDLFDRFRDHARGAALGRNLFERTALVAAVLAHVREYEGRRVAAAAGEKIGDDRRRLHSLRMRRLLAARSPADCLIAFRRLVVLLDRKANVADLAESLLEWPDEMRGDRRRTQWAFDYYGAGSAAPEETDQATA